MDSFWELSSSIGHLYPIEGMQIQRFPGADKEKFIVYQLQGKHSVHTQARAVDRSICRPSLQLQDWEWKQPSATAKGLVRKVPQLPADKLKQNTQTPNPAIMSINEENPQRKSAGDSAQGQGSRWREDCRHSLRWLGGAHLGGPAYVSSAEFSHKPPTSEHSDISQIVNSLCLSQNTFQMVTCKFIILSYDDLGIYLGLTSQTIKVPGWDFWNFIYYVC